MSMESTTQPLDIRGNDYLVDRILAALPSDVRGLLFNLTDGEDGRLATGSAVKKLCQTILKHNTLTRGAAEVLVAELQHYGGNALANVVRGSGISYEQLLEDTLTYLGHTGPKDKKVQLLEESLLRQQLKVLWEHGTAIDQAKIATILECEASFSAANTALEGKAGLLRLAQLLCSSDFDTAALHQNSNLVESASGGAGGAMGGLLGFAVGKVAGSKLPPSMKGKLNKMVSSHRVTLPCINHLIRLRLVQQSADAIAKPSTAGNAFEPLDIPTTESLVVEDSHGEHAISILQAAITGMPAHGRRINPKKQGISRLSSLMQAAPTALTANAISGENYMKVVINGPLQLARDGNGFRGFSHDGKHITEHARLFEANISDVVNAGALFNVASFALAQKHLADISARLDQIKKDVDKIASFQKLERDSVMKGAIEYLQQVAPVVLEGDLRPAIEQKLEDYESELLAKQKHLKAELDAILDQVKNAKDEGKFGMGTFRDKLIELQTEFQESANQWKLCLAARMMACRLLCSFPGTALTVKVREKAIREDLNQMLGEHGLAGLIEAALNTHLGAFSAYGDSRIEQQANRETLKIIQMATLPPLRQDALQLQREFDSLMLENEKPVELLISVRDGQVQEAVVL